MKNTKSYVLYDYVTGVFITVLIVSNVLSSAKIVDLKLNLLGVPLLFDAGTVLFPVSYIFGDILTEVYGYRRARRVIWTGFFCLFLSGVFFNIVNILPGERNWETSVGSNAFRAIFEGLLSFGIVVASLLGYLFGEFSNSFTLAKLKIFTKGKWLWSRTISSTVVGQFLDTFVFVSVATFFGVFMKEVYWSLILTNYLFKVFVEVMMTPLTYTVVGFLKRVEKEDYFDMDTNFNPFALEIFR